MRKYSKIPGRVQARPGCTVRGGVTLIYSSVVGALYSSVVAVR